MTQARPGAPVDLLPHDGEALYFGPVLGPAQAHSYFHTLLQTIDWQHDEVIMFGKRIVTKRKTAWYGDEPYAYTYSRVTRHALPWTPALLELKSLVEQYSKAEYNSCLLNLYHTGDEGMSWHSDDETSIVARSAIASLSLGAVRKFAFKHKQTQEKVSLSLEDGSLLVMKGETQIYWRHALPKTKKVARPRINLTFRLMRGQ